MKLRCNKCGHIFYEDEAYVTVTKEPRDFWGSTVYESFVETCCPCCDSDDVSDYDEWFYHHYGEDEDEEDEEDIAAFEADEEIL